MDDMELLKEFAARHSEEAFRVLVERHIDIVYSVALRQLHDTYAAEEVTQSVFIDLAAKASLISKRTILSGWLFRAVRFAAAKMIRSEVRRQRREQQAAEMETISQQITMDTSWEQMEPVLNEALEQLSETDRCAILLRFFEKKPLKEVATSMGINEAAAKKRVGRAVEKLRVNFEKRGVAIPLAVLLAALSAPAIQAAPAGLASSIAAAAVIKSTTLATSTLPLWKAILKLMALFKIKTAAITTLAVVLAGGTTTYIVHKNHLRPLASQSEEEAAALRVIRTLNSRDLDKAPPQVYLGVEPPPTGQRGTIGSNGKMMGKGVFIKELLSKAYGIHQSRIVGVDALPEQRYAFLVSLPTGQREALQKIIREKLGITAHPESRETEVFLLKSKAGDFPGLQPTVQNGTASSMSTSDGSLNLMNVSIDTLSNNLEPFLGQPVINEADRKGFFDIDLTWGKRGAEPDRESLKEALTKQLGLELAPDKRSVEMLIVDNAR